MLQQKDTSQPTYLIKRKVFIQVLCLLMEFQSDSLERLLSKLQAIGKTGDYVFSFDKSRRHGRHIGQRASQFSVDRANKSPVRLHLNYEKISDGNRTPHSLAGAELQEFVQVLTFMRHDQYKDHVKEIDEFLDKHKVRSEWTVVSTCCTLYPVPCTLHLVRLELQS